MQKDMRATHTWKSMPIPSLWKIFIRGVMLLMVVCTLSTVGYAQFRTSIQGVVTDPTGAVIPGATLTLNDLQTNATITQTSSDTGVYSFNALPADHFTLTVEKGGFQKKVLDNLQLIPEQPNALNVQLEPGAAATTVTVDASQAPAMDTETADDQRTISDNEVQHMPVYERDATSLIRLAPGVLADGALDARRRRIPESGHANRSLIGRRRQSGTLEQYLCHRKWRFGKRQWWPVRH